MPGRTSRPWRATSSSAGAKMHAPFGPVRRQPVTAERSRRTLPSAGWTVSAARWGSDGLDGPAVGIADHRDRPKARVLARLPRDVVPGRPRIFGHPNAITDLQHHLAAVVPVGT